MYTIEVTSAGSTVTYRVNGGAVRRCSTFDILAWRKKLPGCVIYVNGILNTYGA